MYPFSGAARSRFSFSIGRFDASNRVMRDCGLNDIHIVVGHLGYQVARPSGMGRSSACASTSSSKKTRPGARRRRLEARIQGPFLLMLGDIYFHLKAPIKPLLDEVLSGTVNANLVSMRAGSRDGPAQFHHRRRRSRRSHA